MKNSKFTLHTSMLSVACSLCALLVSMAQETEQIKVRFVSFPKSDNPQPVEVFIEEGKTISVDLPTNVISPSYTIKRPTKWILGKSVADANSKPMFKTYGTAPSLGAAEQLVVAIRKGKADADGFTLVPFDESANGFGGGKYLFLNATKVDIASTIGDDKLVIKPLEYKLISPEPVADANNKKLLLVNLFFRKQNEAQPFYSSQWRYSEKARTMVFLYHDSGNERIRMFPIRDYLP